MRFVDPETVVSHFHIRPGDVVADLGAGSGFFLPSLFRAVGETGKVLACEIQRPLVESLGEQIQREGWANVQALWCDLEEVGGIPVGDHTTDIALLVNTFFQFSDKHSALQEVKRIVRPGGKLYLIDWTESYQGLGPRSDMLIPQQDATDLAEENGFTLETTYPAGEHHYGLAFRTQ
jgi:ubiquinone/menaquinone biosynthesis C-methylase UbiE